MGFMDYKDASRTIRTGFTDVMAVSHDPLEFTERHFLMDETLYKGQQVWVSPMAFSPIRGDSAAIFEELLQFYCSSYCKCLRIYFIGIYSECEILRSLIKQIWYLILL